MTAAGWLDTATCEQIGFPVHIAHLDHPTKLAQVIVPEIQYDQAVEHDELALPIIVDASLPLTNAIVQLNSACFEPEQSRSYKVTPVLNGKGQKDLYVSPVVTGSEHGVNQSANIGSITLDGVWNPQPVNGTSQVAVSISAPQCGK